MKHGKKWLRRCFLLLAFIFLAGGLWLAGETWAWPVVSVADRGQITIGSVDYGLQIRLEDSEVFEGTDLEPGRYTVAIVSTGDMEGWFRLCVSSAEDPSAQMYYRTEWLQPTETVSIILQAAETATLTVEPRWDIPPVDMPVLSEGAEIRWEIAPAEETTEDTATETETETETEAETEAEAETEGETEATDSTETEEEQETTQSTEVTQPDGTPDA